MNPFRAADRLRRATQALFLVAVVAAALPGGSTGPIASMATAFVVAVLAIACGVLFRLPRPTARLALAAVTIALVVAAWIGVQSAVVPGNPLASALWAGTAEILGPVEGAISIHPAETRLTIVSAVVPLLAFTAALALFDTDEHDRQAIAVLGWAGAGVAAVTLVLRLVAPDLLPGRGAGAFEGPFLDQNAAATYFGASALMLAAGLLGRPAGAGGRRIGTLAAAAAIALLVGALLLTRSRLGVSASLLGALFLVPALMMNAGERPKAPVRSFAVRPGPRRGRIALIATLALVAIGGAALVLGPGLPGARGFADPRICSLPALVDALSANWRIGTGAGTFEDAFAIYRDPDCGLYARFAHASSLLAEGTLGIGLVFPVVFVVALVLLAHTYVRGFAARRSMRFAPALGIALLLLYTVHGLTSDALTVPAVALQAATAFAATAGVARRRRLASHRPDGSLIGERTGA